MRMLRRSLGLLAATASLFVGAPGAARAQRAGTPFEALTALFAEWRAFQHAPRVDGVPDYSVTAMATQHRALASFQQRLRAMDTTGWSVRQQVDWHVVRAEMNGMDFDHRVLRPWANNPAYYVTVFNEQSDQPAREGPYADGGVELWQLTWPLTPAAAAQLDAGVRIIPALLAQAKRNLVGQGHDLWVYGARALRDQAKELEALAPKVAKAPGTLAADVQRAQAATNEFAQWVEAESAKRTGSSGIGIANYDWYLAHVQLMPLTYGQVVTLMERELARSSAALAVDEAHNAALPPLKVVSSAAEHAKRFAAGVSDYMAWLKARNIITIQPWMDGALRARIGSFSAGPREFFTEVDYRDPVAMRTHGLHWFDLGQMVHAPHADPIRRGPLLYNIFVTRTEGFATGWEEIAMQAGLFDKSPRSRELIWILLAERAARALGDLAMQGKGYTIDQASQLASDGTPRGWLSMKGNLVYGEQHLYLSQPGYGTSYVTGKIQMDALFATRKAQLGDKFTMKGMMDEIMGAGLVPASLVRWELTGVLPDDVRAMLVAP
jgi:hypothetical protein